jgi:outer membrane protein assembly factor BamD
LKKIHISAFFTAILIAFMASVILYGCSSSGSKIETDDPEIAFGLAKKTFDNGDYMDAIDDFSFIKVKFPGASIADKVEFYLAESYYFRKEYLLAAYEFETLQKNFPLSTFIPDSKFMLGLCYYQLSPKFSLDQEFTRYAITELSAFIDQYPDNKNVGEAEKKLEDLKNKLAYKDFFVGENYIKTSNYRAAAIYFQHVYDTYIDSEWADDAMIGHIEALNYGNRNDEALKLLERFYKLFPKSNLKTKADQLKRTILAK